MYGNPLRQVVLPGLLFAGDIAVAFAGLSLAWWIRYRALAAVGVPAESARYADYMPLLAVGVGLLGGTFAHLGLYHDRLLLRRYQSFAIILKGTVFWFAAYLGLSLTLKFQPPISRIFVAVAFLCVVVLLYLWRSAFVASIGRGLLLERIQQRVAILGWSDDAARLVAEVATTGSHPFQIVGLVAEFPGQPDPRAHLPALVLGDFGELGDILHRHRIDILIAAHLDLPPDRLQTLVRTCERHYVELKVVPSIFQVFVSGLRMQTVGPVPVLGVEELPATRLLNRVLKRSTDLVGALVGLAISTPIIAVLAWLIRRESPGPIFYAQERIGAGHRPFTMWKLRSMRPDSSDPRHLRAGFAQADPRLRIGRFMRRWNLDELPQFWNVLRGDMSLVGPRPERPVHVDRLTDEIPHYLPRHMVKPGMTGWAQVNGLRGVGDLRARIQHDIYYIENWSFWLDAQILLLTFVRWRSPAE